MCRKVSGFKSRPEHQFRLGRSGNGPALFLVHIIPDTPQ